MARDKGGIAETTGNPTLDILARLLEEGMNKSNAFKNKDTEIGYDGKKITLPNDPSKMTFAKAIEVLKRKEAEEEQRVRVMEVIDTYPFDGAHGLMQVLRREYGWAEAVPTPGFFGPEPPAFLDVQTGADTRDRIKVIWGRFKIPGIDQNLNCGAKYDERDGRPQFLIHGEIQKKFLPVIEYIAHLVREYVAEHSIYRGKAIILTTDSDGDMNMDAPPGFHDTSKIKLDDLIFSDNVREQILTNLMMPIQKSARCRALGVPLKRGVLLAGPYGCGKTLTADATARVCEDNGWTFIMLRRVSALKQALAFARMYQPAVVFAEDIDRTIEGEERTVEIDDVLNTIDGIESKGTEIICVLTTNHLERINQAMLRPGRLDAIIEVTPPDAAACAKLITLYSRGLLKDGTDIGPACVELEGQIPAVIREAVERSKLYALQQQEEDGEDLWLTGEAILHSARGMKAHLNLLNRKADEEPSPEEAVGIALRDLVGVAITGTPSGGNKSNAVLADIQGRVRNVVGLAREICDKIDGKDDPAIKKTFTQMIDSLGMIEKKTGEIHKVVV